MKFNIKETIQNYIRVLRIAKKPNFEDFSDSAKICFIGIVVVGIIGFIVYLISISVQF